jgi:hypothetical protein
MCFLTFRFRADPAKPAIEAAPGGCRGGARHIIEQGKLICKYMIRLGRHVDLRWVAAACSVSLAFRLTLAAEVGSQSNRRVPTSFLVIPTDESASAAKAVAKHIEAVLSTR